jgi:hypothetical protein
MQIGPSASSTSGYADPLGGVKACKNGAELSVWWQGEGNEIGSFFGPYL